MTVTFPKLAGALLVLGGLSYAFVELSGPDGVHAMIEKRRQVRDLEAENDRLQREIDLKRQRIERLETDPAEQEIEIRRRLKLAGPNEKVFIIGESGEK